MNNIKLLVLAKSVDGGTGTYVMSLLKLPQIFKNPGLEVKVLSLEKPSYRKVNFKKINFYKVKQSYSDKYSFSSGNLLGILNEFTWTKNEVKKFKPDIILTVDSHALIISGLVNFFKVNKITTIATIHNNLESIFKVKLPSKLRSPIKYLVGTFLRNIDLVITVSKELSARLHKMMGLKRMPTTVYNGLPIKKQVKVKKYKKGKQSILTIGRIAEQKDYETLLQTFSLVVKDFPGTELVIVGDGPNKTRIKDLCRKLNIDRKIKFRGWVQNPESLFKQSHIFVLSTKWEGLPYVLIESLHNGVPTISSDVSFGPSEILGKGNKYGILVKPGDKLDMKEAIESLLTDKSLYNHYAQKSINRSEYFSEARMLSDYKKAILSVTKV